VTSQHEPEARRSVFAGLGILMLVPVAWLVIGASGSRGSGEPRPAVRESIVDGEMFVRLTTKGLQHYQRREWDEADSAFRRALAHKPGNAMVLNNLGSIQNERGNHDAAIVLFELALLADPGLQVARNNLDWARSRSAESRR
jgi:tetratricopeptide (TPR) repeat protein